MVAAGKEGSIWIDGRCRYFGRIAKLTQVAVAVWEGETVSGVAFKVEGGKKAGGSSRDWFLDISGGNGSIHCTSMVDALNCINNA